MKKDAFHSTILLYVQDLNILFKIQTLEAILEIAVKAAFAIIQHFHKALSLFLSLHQYSILPLLF